MQKMIIHITLTPEEIAEVLSSYLLEKIDPSIRYSASKPEVSGYVQNGYRHDISELAGLDFAIEITRSEPPN